jgi:uncharacterized protein (DUF924 family)
MSNPSLVTEADVRAFWLGELDERGRASAEKSALWWRKERELDLRIFERFGGLHAVIQAGGHQDWRRAPHSLLAYVLVLDQFSRNMFRGTAGMFASDELALAAAFEGIALGFDQKLRRDERTFLYMPLQHSERIEVQERSVELFEAFAEELSGDDRKAARESTRYAERHRDIVKRFGRFPHRNALLGRQSSVEEVEFLAQPGSSF